MNKYEWLGYLPQVETGYRPWLRDSGSLTRRIQQRCVQFDVCNVYDGLMTAAYDETALLGLPPQRKIYTREVLLLAESQPVVFAHSVLAPQHLRGVWHALQHLGKRPLGALLFAHPLMQRAPLHYLHLKSSHPLYRRAQASLAAACPEQGKLPNKLYARRSLFTLQQAPLLVTEVFLPTILSLS